MEAATETKESTTCITPGCGNKDRSRGLCVNCYNTARNLVKVGRVTWEALEKKGKSKPLVRESGKTLTHWFLH